MRKGLKQLKVAKLILKSYEFKMCASTGKAALSIVSSPSLSCRFLCRSASHCLASLVVLSALLLLGSPFTVSVCSCTLVWLERGLPPAAAAGRTRVAGLQCLQPALCQGQGLGREGGKRRAQLSIVRTKPPVHFG